VAQPPLAIKKIVWDKKQSGLSVLVSQSTRAYRTTFRLDGKQMTVKIDRGREMKLEDARKRVVTYRGQADDGQGARLLRTHALHAGLGRPVERKLRSTC